MTDMIFRGFLERQAAEAKQLSDDSDLVSLQPYREHEPPGHDGPPTRWIVELDNVGLVRNEDGKVEEVNGFALGVWFPDDYLRRVNPAQVVTWFGPINVWHPNILGQVGAMCLGHIAPGTRLVDLVYRCADIVSYHNFASHDALNPEAAQWARNHQERFPLDKRPLKWRRPK